MKLRTTLATVLVSSGLLLITACRSPEAGTTSSGSETTAHGHSKPGEGHGEANHGKSDSSGHAHGGQGGQVIESGPYHLELLPVSEPGGIHLDFFLQTGDNHDPIPDAQVTAQVQLPDGTSQTLELAYDSAGAHYAAGLPTTAAGEYKVAVLSDIAGEKVNGRFTFNHDPSEVSEGAGHHGAGHHGAGHYDGAHHHAPSKATTQATIILPEAIAPGETIPVSIEVRDLDGSIVEDFEIFQEKIMHLIVVGDNLDHFDHIHPEYVGKGRFVVDAVLPTSGNYTFFADYKPKGQSEQVLALKVDIPGSELEAASVDSETTRTLDETQVDFVISDATPAAEQEVEIAFELKDPENQELAKDLQPYLGEFGHLVIVHESDAIERESYIHAHALSGSGPNGVVKFATAFPQAGRYKLWGQFQRDNRILTAPFWVNVQ